MTTPLIYKNSEPETFKDRHLVLCFQVHQPKRLKKLQKDQPGESASLLDADLDRKIMESAAKNCYLPTNTLLLRLIEKYPQIKIAFSISGTALEQMEAYAPKVLDSFKALAATGSVDFLAETYYHSMAFLMDSEEFEIQVLEHVEKIVEHFGVRPTVFRNTSLIYNDDIGRRIGMMGFQGVLTEGNVRAFNNNSPHFLYEHRDLNGLKILMRNSSLSDDIAFRVALSDWHLTAEKFMSWLEAMPENERLVTIALDYETFGEHHKADSGVFEFLENLLLLLAIEHSYKMLTPAEAVRQLKAETAISVPDYLAIAGSELSDWVGNEKQREAFTALIHLESAVKQKEITEVTKLWRYLQASDHFYYMSEKSDHAIHLSPYASSSEAFDHYMKAITTIQQLVHDGPFIDENAEKINEAIEAERRNINTPVWALNIEPHHGYNH